MTLETENPSVPSTVADANPRSEVDLDNLWQREAQAFFSFLPNTPLRNSLIWRLEEVYSARYDLQSPLSKAQQRSRLRTQVQECGAIMEGLLNDRLDQDFKKEILKQYGRKGIRKVQDISMNDKANFAARKGLITEEMKERLCEAYRLRSNGHIDREIRTKYVPSTSYAQETFETMERFVAQLKEYLDKPTR